MKKTILLLTLFFSFFASGFSQLVSTNDNPPIPNNVNAISFVIIDNGNVSGNARAPIGNQRYARTHWIVSQSEMQAAGINPGTSFHTIGFNYQTAASIAVTGNFILYMENTADVTNNKSTDWATAIAPMTTVHNNPITIPAAAGIFDIPLSGGAPFTYTGGSLYIAFDWANAANPLSTARNVWCNAAVVGGGNGLKGAQSVSTPPTTLTSSSFRPATRLGFALPNDASVTQIYTLGKLPIPFASPHIIKANIRNNGDNIQTNLSVTLNITGANTFNNVQIIPSLASGANVDVTFTPFSPTNTGTNSIVVSVPSDDVSTNNSSTVSQVVSGNAYSYAYGPVASGGVGFNAPNTGDFVARFNTNAPTTVNQVSVNFFAGGQPFQIGIWDATGAGGTPGVNLWTSSSQTSTAGVFTLPVSPAIAVNGDFFVGVRQTAQANVSFAYQTENPVRPGTFYYTIPTGGTTWTDFAPANPFRFMIEPRLTLANDVGPSIIVEPTAGTNSLCTTPISPKATVSNYGTVNQTFNTTFEIKQGATVVYTDTKSVTISAGSTQTVTFANTFNPTSGASYSSTVTTSLATDADVTNDVVTNTFTTIQYNYGGGGPTSGGYYFANSTPCANGAPSKPAYNWLTVTTNEVTTWNADGDDGITGPITLPAPFIYFGNVYTQFWICANGWISFTDPTALTPAQRSTPLIIPTPGAVENFIAGFFMDLDVTTATYPDAHVYHGPASGGRYVITFVHAHEFASAANFITFQIILDAGNKITIQFDDAQSTSPFPVSMRDGALIGIENSTGTAGIQYRGGNVGGPIFGSPLAVAFAQNALVLPVTLKSFTAKRVGNSNELNWTISEERNITQYVIERSGDGNNFTSIGQQAAANSTSQRNYQFIDQSPLKGINYYRLRILDVNNSVKYSEVRIVKQSGTRDINITPNPVNGIAHISLDADISVDGSIRLTDMNGKLLYQRSVSITQGANAFDVNMSSFAKGLYIVTVTAGEDQIFKKVNKL